MSLIKVGNAPVSWGVYEADRPNPPFGPILDAIADAGYEGTELGPYGYLPTEPEALGLELKARGLGLGSSFVALPLEDPSRRRSAVEHSRRVARLLATQGVGELILADDEDPERSRIAGRVPADAGWSEAQWREAAATVAAVARAARRAGHAGRRPPPRRDLRGDAGRRSTGCSRRPTPAWWACCSTPGTASTEAATLDVVKRHRDCALRPSQGRAGRRAAPRPHHRRRHGRRLDARRLLPAGDGVVDFRA